MRALSRLLILGCAVLVVTGCATVPVTGRSSLNLIPQSELASMGDASYDQFLTQSKISTDPQANEMVRRVGTRLASATETYMRELGVSTSNLQWEWSVIDDPETANAFVMPGGKVAVYTGILKVAQTDEGLATVLGHEIAHELAGHGNERMSHALLTQLGGAALSVALTNQPALTQNLFMTAYGAGSQVGVLLPYSRLQESEADHIGLNLMARAGYDPRAAVDFWQRMATEGGPRPPTFLSTHPVPENRIASIREHLPEALALYEGRRAATE
jgi:predicted Zn-dependent protease